MAVNPVLKTSLTIGAIGVGALIACYATGILPPSPEESAELPNIILGPLGPLVWVGEIESSGAEGVSGFFILLFVVEFSLAVAVAHLLRRYVHIAAAVGVGILLWAAIGWVNHSTFFFG